MTQDNYGRVPATPQALEEALGLSGEILADVELNRAPLSAIALKASRLGRILNDFDAQFMFRHETSGYPVSNGIVPQDAWNAGVAAGRRFESKDPNGEVKAQIFVESIEQLEEQIATAKLGLEAASDRDVSISSANPYQSVFPPGSNYLERAGHQRTISTATQRLSSRRALIHDYVLQRHYELKFSGIAQDVFSTIREKVDARVASIVPNAVQQFSAVHDNLRSENPEDWSNAVHSCRRILQAVADVLFPPTGEPRQSGGKEIKLGPDQYINRLACYAEDMSSSERFQEIVGSHLSFLGDRLDAVFEASQKGSHGAVGRDEANRYVVYTYMLVGDILSLSDE